ncbi:MAG: hypothetical protein NUV31_10530 [Dehalococcoidales bacterium]|jgi:hypothetical protein|nr:hypothetical protein [Dehalococcoidales bacterium]
MGLFSKSCPLEKAYLKVYGIHSPKKWTEADCAICEYYQNSKCIYTQVISTKGDPIKRGRPAIVKRAHMTDTPAIREQAEKAAIREAGFTAEEQKEYWSISIEYNRQWEIASDEQKQEILDGLTQWKVYLEKGLSPAGAHEKVKEWLQQRAAFRQQRPV